MKRKLTAKELKIFENEFGSLIHEIFQDMVHYRRIQLQIMKETEGGYEFDLREFARESFWHHLRTVANEGYDMEAAVQSAKRIIEVDEE